MTAITVQDIGIHVGTFQLHNLAFSIPKGKMTAIVGPNGSGKSTLLKILAQLLHADQGQVYIEDKEAKAYKAKELAQTLAMLPQSKHLLPDLTVRELVSYGRSPHKGVFGRTTSEDESIIDWALEVTGTKKHEQRMFQTLSGGEQQKARIAMALAQKTNILLLDEPTTFLDIAHQFDVMEMLHHINQEYQLTIVMVLHELQQAAKYCHQMIAMKRGKIVASGSPQAVLTAHFLREVYEIEAKVRFEDEYPLIIPIIKK